MQTFLEPLDIEYLDETTSTQNFKILQPFQYITADNHTITVPIGFVTDMASVPKMVWDILPPDGPYGKAAVIHDYLYRNGGVVAVTPLKVFTKAESDSIFYEAMGVLGVSQWKRWVMYKAVQVFGASSFKGKGN